MGSILFIFWTGFGSGGVVVTPITDIGLEWTLRPNLMHHTLPEGRMHYTLPVGREHWTMPNEDNE